MNKKNKQNSSYGKGRNIILLVIIIFCILLTIFINENDNKIPNTGTNNYINIDNIPLYNGNAFIKLNDNIPEFKEEDFTTTPFENYSDLDEHQRCGVAFANICKDTMPKENEKRGKINYKPTGWVQNEYPYIINTIQLYNRCHLIAWQLSAENNKKENLMTGTAYLNQAMIDWENDIADYIKKNEKHNYHVLYRVTPIFKEENKLASGVHMEAMSVEEREKGIYFNIYIYNVQPNIEIDYATGQNYEKLLLTE